MFLDFERLAEGLLRKKKSHVLKTIIPSFYEIFICNINGFWFLNTKFAENMFFLLGFFISMSQ